MEKRQRVSRLFESDGRVYLDDYNGLYVTTVPVSNYHNIKYDKRNDESKIVTSIGDTYTIKRMVFPREITVKHIDIKGSQSILLFYLHSECIAYIRYSILSKDLDPFWVFHVVNTSRNTWLDKDLSETHFGVYIEQIQIKRAYRGINMFHIVIYMFLKMLLKKKQDFFIILYSTSEYRDIYNKIGFRKYSDWINGKIKINNNNSSTSDYIHIEPQNLYHKLKQKLKSIFKSNNTINKNMTIPSESHNLFYYNYFDKIKVNRKF